MPLNIRDPRASELARTLAARRGTNMTEAIISALEDALRGERAKMPLSKRASRIASGLTKAARGKSRKVTKVEIDEMWGQ